MTTPATLTVLGLDVSLSSTGWAVLTLNDGHLVDCGLITTNPKDHIGARLRQIHRAVKRLGTHADVGIEEGIAYRSRTATRLLAAAWGAAVIAIGDDPHLVNVSSVKRLATGNGKASKDEMVAAAVARWGDRTLADDIADACWIAEATRLHLIAEIDNHRKDQP